MTTEMTDQTGVSAATTSQEAAWARMEAVVRPAAAPAPATAPAPAPAAHTAPPSPPARRRRAHVRPRRHLRRALVAALVLAAAAAAVAVAGRIERGAPTPAATHHGVPASTTTTARLDSATSDAEAAVAAAREGLSALSGMPTPSTVAPVTDALASSLRLYGTVLAASPVPRAAGASALAVESQARSDATRLQGVATMPPALLGAFLEDLTTRMGRLDAALGSLRDALEHPPTTH